MSGAEPLATAVLLDYDADVARCQGDITELQLQALAVPADVAGASRLLYRRYHLHTLTGHVDDLPALRGDVEDAIARLGPNGDLCLLLGQIDFALHRFADVAADLDLAPGLAASRPARALLADVGLHRGMVAAARAELERLREPPDWDVLARLGGAYEACGEERAADRAYATAQDQLSAKQMRAFAWLELQRGRLDLRLGHPDTAGERYERADRAYTGYWLVHEHLADLWVLSGRLQEAEALLRQVLRDVPRPTARQRLGRVLASQGRHDEARAEYAAALTAYEASAAAGHVHYLHHLVDFFTSVQPDHEEAARWARLDAATRREPGREHRA